MSLCINIEGLGKSYKNNIVIDNLSLSVDESEIIVFQGPSGIGKSTFLRCLTYLEPFQKGVVKIGDIKLCPGMDIHRDKNTIKGVRKQLGFVFQFFNLFPHLTVMENLTIGPTVVLKEHPAEAHANAMRLLNRVGLEHKSAAYPGALSGGQLQRVAIARALAMHPKAVLFDEPTSSLDPDSKEEIVKVIEEFMHDHLTMLIVTHEPKFVERIATRIVKFGEHCKILSDEKH